MTEVSLCRERGGVARAGRIIGVRSAFGEWQSFFPGRAIREPVRTTWPGQSADSYDGPLPFPQACAGRSAAEEAHPPHGPCLARTPGWESQAPLMRFLSALWRSSNHSTHWGWLNSARMPAQMGSTFAQVVMMGADRRSSSRSRGASPRR